MCFQESDLEMIFYDLHALARKLVGLSADRLAQLVEHQTAVREVAGSNLGRTNTQGL